jgi:hypothetical protein
MASRSSSARGLAARVAGARRRLRRGEVAAISNHLDPTTTPGLRHADNLEGVKDADFVGIGLGSTNMMAMLWTIAMGRRVVGVELRGDPALGVHFNIREDFYHHLGLIDELMLERWGEDRIPRRGDGKLYKLRECFYEPGTEAGGIYTDEVLTGFLSSFDGTESRIGGLVHHVEFIDDRWNSGEPQRVVTIVPSPTPPTQHDPTKIGRPVKDVLDGPSTFQAGASEILVMLRRYLEMIEEMDLAAGLEPRCRLFLSHRVVAGDPGDDSYLRWFKQEEGFVDHPDGRKGIKIEAVRELDFRGKFHRTRIPGTEVIDLGTPELFMIAEGFQSDDAERLGFQQEEVRVDHRDGRGPVVAQADYLAGLVEINVGGRLRRRIASEFDKAGNEYWVRQIAVGHEDDPEVGWILVQVPDFKTFDPILAGLVPPGTNRKSKEYLGAYQHLLREFYLDQVSLITEMPVAQLEEVQMPYGPKLFSLIEKVGADAQVATNGVVGGDSFGNGHFLTSGGAITGMVGHASRVFTYWQDRDKGLAPEVAIKSLAQAIKEDTDGWLQVSAQEFSQAAPINFGARRIAEIEAHAGRDGSQRATTIDATRRHRHSLVPLNPSDWRRLVIRAGRLHAEGLPPLSDTHPLLRDRTMATGESIMPTVLTGKRAQLAGGMGEDMSCPVAATGDGMGAAAMAGVAMHQSGDGMPGMARTAPVLVGATRADGMAEAPLDPMAADGMTPAVVGAGMVGAVVAAPVLARDEMGGDADGVTVGTGADPR